MSQQDLIVEPAPAPAAGPEPVAAFAAGKEAVSQAFRAGNITGSRVNLIGEASGGTFVGDAPGSMFIGAQYVELSRERKAPVRQFSCRDGLRVSEEEEKATLERFPGSDAEVERLLQHLEERRVLVLAAERGAGKLSAAIYLGTQLRRQRGCGNETVLADSLDRRVHVDIRHLAERDTELAGRLVVFRKPFGRADPELARAFQKTDRAGWDQLAARLRQQDAYLVFTADPEDVAAFRERPAARELVQALLPHPSESVARVLRDKLASLEGMEAAEGLRGREEQLLTAFHFTSSLAEFIDFYADQYQPGLQLDEAVARYHDTSEWLLQELERDFEFWSFGFTLALAQCLPGARGVAWLDFDRLHRRIRQWLRRDLNQRSPSAGDDEVWELEESHPALSEEPLLRRCRAEIAKDSSTLADVVHFRDGTPPERLWAVILGRHRRALTTILPGLRDLAENGQPDLRSLRVLAAQVLGRIGEMDPARVTLPLLERWTRSAGGRHHLVVGPLLEGVLGSANDRYRCLCFAHLQRLHTGARADGEGGLVAVHAAIGAYGWMGDHDLALAMRELGGIAREHLVPMIADVQALARGVTELETACLRHAAPGANLRDVSPACSSLLSSLIEIVFMEKGQILLRTQIALLTLCSTTDPVRVFREMRKWVREGGWQAGVLAGLLFLHERGIAAALAGGREGAADDGSGAAAGDPIVSSLAAGGDEVRHMAGFLGDIYESFSTPHLVDARLLGYCRDSLQEHLLGWIREALPVPAHAAAMRSLLHAMARTHDGVLREPMEKLFARGEFFDPAVPKLRAFAASLAG